MNKEEIAEEVKRELSVVAADVDTNTNDSNDEDANGVSESGEAESNE